jgi:hypothetical protein
VEDGMEHRFPLESLTLDMLCSLVKKLAIKGYCSSTKFRCRQLIGEHVVYQQCYNDEIWENSAAAMKKKLNSELQMIPTFFHPDLFEQIMKVNSLKDRADHENGTNEKQAWSSVADLYNNSDPDPELDKFDSMAVKDLLNHLITKPGYDDMDLKQFTEMTDNGNGIKKYITGLFKLQREMKNLITTVGDTQEQPHGIRWLHNKETKELFGPSSCSLLLR